MTNHSSVCIDLAMDSRPSSPGQPFVATSSASRPITMPRSDSVVASFSPEPSPVHADCPLGLPRAYPPLVLQCVNCFTTSTWFSPPDERIRRRPVADVPPPLSTSSRSTSSEPGSVNTDFFPETLPPSNDSACTKRVSANLSHRLTTTNESDGRTPVVGTFKSSMSDCQVSSNTPWTGGKTYGVCSSCSSKSMTPLPSRILPHDPATFSIKPTSLLSDSLASRHQQSSSPIALRESTPAKASNFSTKDSQSSEPESKPRGTPGAQPLNKDVTVATGMLDKTSLELSPITKNNRLGPRPHGFHNISPSLPSIPVPFPLKKGGAPHQEGFPVNHSNSLRPRALTYTSPSARVQIKSPRKLPRYPDRKDMALELKDNDTETTPPPSAASLPQDVAHRGTNLRTLLREAKIPQSDSDDSFSYGRRPAIAVDMWQAAMISTPRDRLRNADFPNWQVYSGTDSPFYQHLCGLSSVSTSSLSCQETLLSTSVASFHDNSLGVSRSCSPPTDKHSHFDASMVYRRPSLGGKSTGDPFPPRASELRPSAEDNSRHLLSSADESQEVLKAPPPAAKTPRATPSNVSLITRIANLHQNAAKSNKSSKRRPNTATGTTEPTFIAKASPKPGSYGRSTPCPNTAVGLPSLLLTKTKVASAEPRVSNLNMYKRPATATCTGSISQSAFSLSNELATRQFPVSRLPTGKNAPTYVPSLPTIQGRGARNDHTDSTKGSSKFDSPISEASPPQQVVARGESTPPVLISNIPPPPPVVQQPSSTAALSQSVPNLLINHRSSSSKRNAFYAAAALAVTSERLTEVDTQRPHLENPLRLPAEDFHSKSRYLTLSVSPRPTSATFSPGQKISIHVRLSNKVKVRKYTTINLMFLGSNTSEGDMQGSCTHDFLRHNYMIHPNPSDDVRTISHSADLCEWHIELTIPGYANCPCQPGPLPLPSTGTHASGEVSYSLQLYADRKQLLSNQESLIVKLHLNTQAEARYQVTTQPFRTQSRKGRIPFAGGYLGTVEELSLSHQVYYQSADRLRVGYQFELQLSANSFLPAAIAEDVSRATKVEVHQLIKEQSGQCGLKFTDHRSKVVVIPSDDQGYGTKWIIKGFLELKAVTQQMKSMRATVEGTPRTPRRIETSAGARSVPSSSHGSMSPTGGSITHSLQQETERQAKLNSSQLFLTASIEHCPGVFTTSIEVSSLVGSELLSPCPLRKLGDEMMKRAVMAEKMKKVQEENSKNDK
ncbi:hypothetical protein PSTG_15146 [Puccinia striiformis f. sp. tritici PST-78]|uniref:Uncharacterized protein n=1 Tax=Puccinia striiformis f. sp. tritici PST-78 TaxID=1165861 RepID=A0A0L0UWY1_9BASI|nr:hypothetical protein PSTG_15146 [Puccinia striiformis f. sp. tritici PST-78]